VPELLPKQREWVEAQTEAFIHKITHGSSEARRRAVLEEAFRVIEVAHQAAKEVEDEHAHPERG
jgi:hypothetical protein